MPLSIVTSGSRAEILGTLEEVPNYEGCEPKFGQWVGSLHRFGHECQPGDYILYYDPSMKHVQICEVITAPGFRDFDLEALDTHGEEVDIWHYRKVKLACPPIPITDFYGSLKGKLLGPRGTIWQLHGQFEVISKIARGLDVGLSLATDPEIQAAKSRLEELIKVRTEALNERDWELLAADYFRSQGALVEEKTIGGNRSVIDFEAVFDHGDIPESTWRVQVKRYQNRPVGAAEIKKHADNVGDAHFCFVSVFGFTDDARELAENSDILLLQAESFSSFILGGKLRETLTTKLKVPR